MGVGGPGGVRAPASGDRHRAGAPPRPHRLRRQRCSLRIHLLRHPDSFVSSGIQRNWYTGKTITDEGRIAPAKDLGIERQQDKIAWLWNATNAFIDDFKEGAGKDRTLTVRSEDLFSNAEEAERILNWLDFQADKASIQKVLNTPVNSSRKKKTPQEYNVDLTPLVKKYYGN